MNVLIIAPHPDDEVLGCGGTIANYSKMGASVHLCIITKAYTPDWSEEYIKNRKYEINEVNKILGIAMTHNLNFPAAKLDTIQKKEIVNKLSRVINKVKPEIVFIPHLGDIHQDHQVVSQASLIALRPIRKLKIKKILAYETLSETEWGSNIKPFLPNVYIDITNTLQKKLKAMKIYQSEIKKGYHPRSIHGIKSLASKRGSEIGIKFAEAFMMIREYAKI